MENEIINSYLKAVTADQYIDYKLWKSIKRLKRSINEISPIQIEDGEWAKNNEEKAKVFAEYLVSLVQMIWRDNWMMREEKRWREGSLRDSRGLKK